MTMTCRPNATIHTPPSLQQRMLHVVYAVSAAAANAFVSRCGPARVEAAQLVGVVVVVVVVVVIVVIVVVVVVVVVAVAHCSVQLFIAAGIKIAA